MRKSFVGALECCEIPGRLVPMTSKTKKTLSAATALAALAGSFIGAGTANAQMSSKGLADIERWMQTGWSAFSSSVINKGGSHMLLKNLPEGAKPLPAEKAKAALKGTMPVKGDASMTVTFGPDGELSFFDGCNAGSAGYSIDRAGAVKVRNIAETQRLCDPTTMNKADELKSVLRSNPSVYRFDNETIALAAQGKAIEFTKATAN